MMGRWAVYLQTASGWQVVRKGLTFDMAVRKVSEYQAINPGFEYCVNTY
jgi:hypothetical protein